MEKLYLGGFVGVNELGISLKDAQERALKKWPDFYTAVKNNVREEGIISLLAELEKSEDFFKSFFVEGYIYCTIDNHRKENNETILRS